MELKGDSDTSSAQETLGSFLSVFNPPKILQVQDLPRLLFDIIDEATQITKAERGTLYLVDQKKGILTSYIAHGLATETITLPIGSGAAGHVARTGKLHNCPDVNECPFFDKGSDARTGFKTRSMLSAPVINQKNLIIGIIQLVNKQPHFTAGDEKFVETFASYIAVSIENAQLYKEREKTFRSAVEMITSAIDKRDPATAGHSVRVSRLCLSLAQEMGLSENELAVIGYAALLHDIGKIGVPDAVLLKPGRLDDDEYATIKLHAVHTGEILYKMHWPEEWHDIPAVATMHHERLDGSGYPKKHTAREMPFIARILALADTYDALVAIDRPYRRALSHKKVVDYLGEEVKKDLYDNTVYEALNGLDPSLLKSIYGDRIFHEEP
ncbi:MAG: GAF domain-containing protein [Candidatus Brocadiales bacterium]|nr:GAF domain-containing protein [Candidatus Bathyanammoxibius amoris]